MIFSYCVTILIVSLSFIFYQTNPSWCADEKEVKEETTEKTSPETESDTEKASVSDKTKGSSEVKSSETEEVIPSNYEVYPITVPRVELPEDVHIVDSNLNLPRGKHTGFPQTPHIEIAIKKGNMNLNLDIDPTYLDLYFDINLKDLGVEDAKVPKELKSVEKPEDKIEKEKTAQQERLLNRIDEMMKAIEKSKQTEKELKEKEEEKAEEKKKEVLTKRQMENKILSHIDKAQRFYYKKKYGLALNEVQESLKVGESAMAYALEGTIYLALDDTTSAVSSWKKALELNPNMKEVKDILEFYENEEE